MCVVVVVVVVQQEMIILVFVCITAPKVTTQHQNHSCRHKSIGEGDAQGFGSPLWHCLGVLSKLQAVPERMGRRAVLWWLRKGLDLEGRQVDNFK